MTWRNGTFLAGLFVITGFGIAFAIPERPLAHPLLEAVVSTVGTVVPAVQNVVAQSRVPEKAQVYWAVMCIWSLLWVPVFFILKDHEVVRFPKSRGERVRLVMWPLIAILVFICVFFMPFSPGRISSRMLGSVWGLALLGSLLFAGVPLFVRVFAAWWRYVPRIFGTQTKEKGDRDG